MRKDVEARERKAADVAMNEKEWQWFDGRKKPNIATKSMEIKRRNLKKF